MIAGIVLVVILLHATVWAEPRRQLEIPAGPATERLMQLAREGDVSIIFDYEATNEHRTNAISGNLDVESANSSLQSFCGGAAEATTFDREAQTNPARGTGMNLYGLGSRATLVLLNGRCLAPSGSAGTFTDISNIPLSAIDHVKVLSDGASTLYGAGAIGGIVNFVFRVDPNTRESEADIGARTPGSLGEDLFRQPFGKARDGDSGPNTMIATPCGLPTARWRPVIWSPFGGSNWGTPFGFAHRRGRSHGLNSLTE